MSEQQTRSEDRLRLDAERPWPSLHAYKEEMEGYFATDCMECGSCSYVCPSNIPIVHLIRVSKNVIREREAERRAEAQGKAEESKEARSDTETSDPKSGQDKEDTK